MIGQIIVFSFVNSDQFRPRRGYFKQALGLTKRNYFILRAMKEGNRCFYLAKIFIGREMIMKHQAYGVHKSIVQMQVVQQLLSLTIYHKE